MPYHLCLDLDNTLVYTEFDTEIFSKLDLNDPQLKNKCRLISLIDPLDKDKKGIGKITKALVIFRPHLFEFIEFCKNFFDDISIWSAGQERYVRVIDYLIFPDNNKGPKNVFTCNDCVFLEDNTTFKELIKKGFDLKKTLSLDDREDTFSKNKENGVLIPIYNPSKNKSLSKSDILKEDRALLDLIDWLKKNNNSQDVRLLNKSNIFSQKI